MIRVLVRFLISEILGVRLAIRRVFGLVFRLFLGLGLGVRLFDRPGGANVKLERLNLTEAPAATNLWLRVVR